MSTWEDKDTRVRSLPSEDTVRRQLSASQEEVLHQNLTSWDFPGGPVVKNPPASAGDTGSIWDYPTCCGIDTEAHAP